LAGDRADKRDLAYLKAVGLFRRGQHVEARRVLKSLLEEHPEFRQGSNLLELVEKEIVKDGLIGASVAAAVLGVVAVVAGAAMSSKR
jgi:mitochondrial fission 1 protein